MYSSKRISFSESDASHLYELSLQNFQTDKDSPCFLCVIIKKRLEKFLGDKEVGRIKRIIKKNPYKR
jgi:hypothetical protein